MALALAMIWSFSSSSPVPFLATETTTGVLSNCSERLTDIDLVAFVGSDIALVEQHHHRNADLLDLDGEVEVTLQVGGIQHIDHQVDISRRPGNLG